MRPIAERSDAGDRICSSLSALLGESGKKAEVSALSDRALRP
jgi:hypothetical protein